MFLIHYEELKIENIFKKFKNNRKKKLMSLITSDNQSKELRRSKANKVLYHIITLHQKHSIKLILLSQMIYNLSFYHYPFKFY